ncbi:hypothetical protein [Dickeya fangzhongdai]|uniref:hypothetical protein n=1 Tax=Dickeya fangzhongdai TaxID=1778540 RepID=UPI000AA5CA76|nr:hypothetical protein [Dickeya fangzhongdai]
MNNSQFKDFLRSNARIVDKTWSPTDTQLDTIRALIHSKILAGERIGYLELQNIVIKVCGSMRVMVTSSVDNSDLNALLIAAMKK